MKHSETLEDICKEYVYRTIALSLKLVNCKNVFRTTNIL